MILLLCRSGGTVDAVVSNTIVPQGRVSSNLTFGTYKITSKFGIFETVGNSILKRLLV
jgi:hypothetical protein